MTKKIAFQGALGAYSHEACNAARPDLEPLACKTFDQVIAAVNSGQAEYAMLPWKIRRTGAWQIFTDCYPKAATHYR